MSMSSMSFITTNPYNDRESFWGQPTLGREDREKACLLVLLAVSRCQQFQGVRNMVAAFSILQLMNKQFTTVEEMSPEDVRAAKCALALLGLSLCQISQGARSSSVVSSHLGMMSLPPSLRTYFGLRLGLLNLLFPQQR